MTDREHLRYLAETLCWMGGKRTWSVETIAEQLGRENDAVLLADVDRAIAIGLIEVRHGGVVLTDAGWSAAAGAE